MPIASLSDYKDKDSDDEDRQNYYAGGQGRNGGGSGQEILDPTKKKKVTAEDVMRGAREAGAVAASDIAPDRFAGAGHRLDGSAPVAPTGPKQKTVTFWKNGFSVDDGPLRNPEANEIDRAFIEAIQRGRYPAEFESLGDTDVHMINRQGDAYVAPKPKPFSGTGQTLSGAPKHDGPIVEATKPNVDDKLAKTTLQIRLHNGTRLTQEFNTEATVQDLVNFVSSATPGCAFQLATTFPRQVLSNMTQTLAAAGLLNAAVVQTLT